MSSPASSIPSTCSTARRRPRTIGFPPKISGSTVIRARRSASVIAGASLLRRPQLSVQASLREIFARERWWSGAELNRRPQHFQCCALPAELPDHARARRASDTTNRPGGSRKRFRLPGRPPAGGRPRRQGPGRPRRLADLADQGLAAGEGALVAELADQLDLDALAVEVEVDARDVDLEDGRAGSASGVRRWAGRRRSRRRRSARRGWWRPPGRHRAAGGSRPRGPRWPSGNPSVRPRPSPATTHAVERGRAAEHARPRARSPAWIASRMRLAEIGSPAERDRRRLLDVEAVAPRRAGASVRRARAVVRRSFPL